MNTPIILICGAAGSGKDTVAGFIKTYGGDNVNTIAQADPMKQFAGRVFDFTEHQLWGPSEARNGKDERFGSDEAWNEANRKLHAIAYGFVEDVLPGLGDTANAQAIEALKQWFRDVYNAHMDHTLSGRAVPTQILTPRYVLQTLGTEWGRRFSASMWNDYAIRSARALLGGGCAYNRRAGLIRHEENAATPDKILAEQTVGSDMVVITDGRFRNEIMGVKAAGGTIVKVTSPAETDLTAGVIGHKSETEQKLIPGHFYDFVVVNDKKRGLLALENVVLNMVKRIQVKPQVLSTEFVYRRMW